MNDAIVQMPSELSLCRNEILQTSEVRNQTLLHAIPDAIFRIRRDGTYLDFKPSLHGDLTLSPEAILGKQVSEIMPAPVSHQILLHLQQALDTGQPQVFDYQLQNNSLQDYEARIVVNGKDEVLAIVRDISDRKKVERLKNEFVSTVSHELRTPLTSIRGALGLVLGGVTGEIPPEAKDLLNIAYKNSERLVLLINDILDIEKIESGKMNFVIKPVHLLPLVEQAIAANRVYAEQFNVTLNLVVHCRPEQMVNVDSERLIQVLTNLLSNAAKFSPQGETVTVIISQHDRMIRISVQDRGSGIPKEFRDRIFQKFAQADSSDTRQKGGSGLGLSIAKAITERFNGQLSFITEMGVGTTFYCDLPEWLPYCNLSNTEQLATTDLSASKVAGHILVCEDDHDIALLLKLMLQRGGFHIDLAYTAAEAKRLLAQHSYHAMTLDLALPDQDGISLLRELRTQEQTRSLPVVIVSAKAQQGREHLGEAEFAIIDWLDKPIDQERLMSLCYQAVLQRPNARPKILHIEDDIDIAQVVKRILNEQADVHQALNLDQARQKLEAEGFDLIILDISLPDGSGLELAPFVNHQTGLPIPVVLFSACDTTPASKQQVTKALIKSRTSNQELLNTIKSLVQSRR
ncbi:ATP-binding response regulator [Pantanalinema sp. GBBB05]|uniref:ATP-binding response regulator n=1 Tax=Pantanalinema sp. GBBB05 TaxID=2604139 RepID=UPI003D818AD0